MSGPHTELTARRAIQANLHINASEKFMLDDYEYYPDDEMIDLGIYDVNFASLSQDTILEIWE